MTPLRYPCVSLTIKASFPRAGDGLIKSGPSLFVTTSTFKGVTNGSPYTTKGPPLDTP